MTPGRAAPLLLLLAAACRDSSSPPPTAPSSPPGSSSGSTAGAFVSGVVVETVSRTAVVGALVESAFGSARTGAAGSFQLPAGGAARGIAVTVSASAHVTRKTTLPVSPAASAADVEVDVIETGSLWSLDFYRELARNGAGGGKLLPLNPWTMEPRVYVDRRPESGSHRIIPDASVETVRTAIGQVLPLLTDGRLRGDDIEVGTDPPPDETPGTVVIRWDPVEIARSSGAASGITRGVGGNASVVLLRSIEETGVIYHELGHVLGLYHPLGGYRPSLMSGPGKSTPPFFTDWDVFHTRVIYARPPGNTDIDNDPADFALGLAELAPSAGHGIEIVCTPEK